MEPCDASANDPPNPPTSSLEIANAGRLSGSALDAEWCSSKVLGYAHRSPFSAQFSPPTSVRPERASYARTDRTGLYVRCSKLLWKTEISTGLSRAHESKFIGILRAFRRDFTCALLINSCSAGREPVVGPSESVNL